MQGVQYVDGFEKKRGWPNFNGSRQEAHHETHKVQRKLNAQANVTFTRFEEDLAQVVSHRFLVTQLKRMQGATTETCATVGPRASAVIL